LLEEERRLLYVAMTRARDELHLLVPHRFFSHQQARFGDSPPVCRPQPLHSSIDPASPRCSGQPLVW
jgi:superfamily I DNA/RNA helicase